MTVFFVEASFFFFWEIIIDSFEFRMTSLGKINDRFFQLRASWWPAWILPEVDFVYTYPSFTSTSKISIKAPHRNSLTLWGAKNRFSNIFSNFVLLLYLLRKLIKQTKKNKFLLNYFYPIKKRFSNLQFRSSFNFYIRFRIHNTRVKSSFKSDSSFFHF